jgi:predicted DCC family thiol-disulfide oxidoreductase YuxK
VKDVLLIYDGDCRLCRFGMQIVRALDIRRAFVYCPFGKPEAEDRLRELPEGERHEVFHAVKDDVLYSGSGAAKVTMSALPLGWIPAALGLHNLYPLIANNRGTLGRLVPVTDAIDTCTQAREPVRPLT